MFETDLTTLLQSVRHCQICKDFLPLEPKPILQVATTARILIIGQAPGIRAHESGITFNDPSGDRLRQWLAIDRDTFYDSSRVAIMPMGFCYPGTQPKGGDEPPRHECAPFWHAKILALLPNIKLTLLVGSYSLNYVFGKGKVSERVKNYQQFLPRYFPLPHPSWRTLVWAKNNPYFEKEIIPLLRNQVKEILLVSK